MPFLKLFGTLFLNLSHPVEVPIRAPQIWISKQDTLKAEVIGNKVILKGLKNGSVFVSGIGSAKEVQRVQVLSPSSFKALEKCGAKDLELSGELLQLIANAVHKTSIERLSKCGFENIGISAVAQEKLMPLLIELEGSLSKNGLQLADARWSEDGLRQLKLNVNDAQKDLAKTKNLLGIFKIFYVFETKARAQPGKTLNFETTLFEFSRQKARQLGISFPGSMRLWSLENGAEQNSHSTAAAIGLDFGESEGVGKILARPKIRTQPGQKAVFQSGGELPVKSHNLHSTNTVWKPYGLQIEILPDLNTQTGAQEVSLSFRIEISEPDFSTLIDGMPAMKLRKLENRFDLRVNETTVLTSLIQLRKGKGSKGVAGLKEFPLLGGLFESNNQMESETELYFALYPTWDEIL